MAVTYGFYNSVNNDRKYNAQQMSMIFDGIIFDGVFSSVGDAFAVSPISGMKISVGTGRAWFNHTWTYNDSPITLTIGAAPLGSLSRIDAVVLEVNETNRINSIKLVAGTAAPVPTRPSLVNTSSVHQYALAYITIDHGVTSITAEMIQSVIGMTETPFVTGPLTGISVEGLYNWWRIEFEEWLSHLQNELDSNQAANLQHQIDILDATKVGIEDTNLRFTVIDKSMTLTVPSDFPGPVHVIMFGGGGGGGGPALNPYTNSRIYSGGGGSGYMEEFDSELIPDNSYSIVIGSGGAGGTSSSSDGENGGDTIFTILNVAHTAHGGKGGKAARLESGVYKAGDGGDGGSGGGGGGIGSAPSSTNAKTGNGGNAQYGGGGGYGKYIGSVIGAYGTYGTKGTYGGQNGGSGTPLLFGVSNKYLDILYNWYFKKPLLASGKTDAGGGLGSPACGARKNANAINEIGIYCGRGGGGFINSESDIDTYVLADNFSAYLSGLGGVGALPNNYGHGGNGANGVTSVYGEQGADGCVIIFWVEPSRDSV